MLPAESMSLSAVLGLAAGAGVVHTLLGPDHYLPLISAARARNWTARRLVVVIVSLGLLHCLASLLLVLALSSATAWIDTLGGVSGWLMVAAGISFTIHAWRKRRRQPNAALVFLTLAFAVGPCEWLIPVAVATGQAFGTIGILQVAALYTAATVGTMVATVLVGSFGLARMPRSLRSEAAAGVICTGCGALMLVLAV